MKDLLEKIKQYKNEFPEKMKEYKKKRFYDRLNKEALEEDERLRANEMNSELRDYLNLPSSIEIFLKLLKFVFNILHKLIMIFAVFSIFVGVLSFIKPDYSEKICNQIIKVIAYRKFDWNDIVLNEYIPRTVDTVGLLHKNNKYELELRLDKKTKDDFYDYIERLKEQSYLSISGVNYDEKTNVYTFILVPEKKMQITIKYYATLNELRIIMVNENVDPNY